MGSAIWWIRRDLRLSDNQALEAATKHGDHVLAVFILDRALWRSEYVGAKRTTFLLDGLQKLDFALQERGARLIVREGDPRAELANHESESGATAIFAEEDVSPYARRRDAGVKEALPLQLQNGLTVYPPGSILKQDGDPYVVYTPFRNSWKELAPPRAEDLLPAPESLASERELSSMPLPAIPVAKEEIPFPAGEQIGGELLRAFTSGKKAPIFSYAEQRDFPGLGGTSQLSPYLRFGMVSARQAAVAAFRALDNAPSPAGRKGAETWLNELIWRDFYMNILYHFPRVRRESFRSQYDQIAWENDLQKVNAWQDGRTGYPFVDAAMRQLAHQGWMHNRARMVTASFLTKDLLVDWRLGEKWFMQQLVDGDPAANNGGWQWTAGTGTDAAPYFRIFNPITQSKKFDPEGRYIRRWVPELENVPDKYLHDPWNMPPDVQEASGCLIGHDYPAPVVDHRQARERALAAYRAVSD